MNKENFKSILKEKYGDKIISLEDYKNARTKIKFLCAEHGEFYKTPYEIITLGRGCLVCNGYDKIKKSGYWNIKSNVIEEAKKYYGKYDFQKHCEGGYNSAIKHGWLNEIGELYDNTIHYRNPSEKIHVIYAYIFEEFKTVYVGRTSNLKRRHRQHTTVTHHSNGSVTMDSVLSFITNKNIKIPQPFLLEENLDAEESQEKEKTWLDYYKNMGYSALNKAPTGKYIGSLGATVKWTYESCKKESLKYKNRHKFKLGCQSAYQSSLKNKWLDEFFPNKKKRK